MSNQEPAIDRRAIPMAPPESESQAYLIYQGVDGMPMHVEGKYYFAPRSFNITRGRFCDHFETPEQAKVAATRWASRFQNPNSMQW